MGNSHIPISCADSWQSSRPQGLSVQHSFAMCLLMVQNHCTHPASDQLAAYITTLFAPGYLLFFMALNCLHLVVLGVCLNNSTHPLPAHRGKSTQSKIPAPRLVKPVCYPINSFPAANAAIKSVRFIKYFNAVSFHLHLLAPLFKRPFLLADMANGESIGVRADMLMKILRRMGGLPVPAKIKMKSGLPSFICHQHRMG